MSRSARTRPGFRLIAATALGLTALTAFAAPAGAVPPARQGTIPGAWIVTLDEGSDPRGVSGEHSRRHGAQVDHVYEHALRGYAARMSDQAAARLAQDPRVASVERDQVVTIAGKPTAPAPTPPAQTRPTGIDRIDAELSLTAAIDGGGVGINVDVAVIDTGIDLDHPDLNVVGGKNCQSGKSFDDGNGHGTHVAGTIGAKDDVNGVVGVAPGANLHAVRVLNNQGSGSWSSIICGIDWVTANASVIEVANMSLGGGGKDSACIEALHAAVCRSVAEGVTYVVAAGNETDDAANHVPAAYDEVITVSALADFNGAPGGGAASTCRADVDDTLADFSNFGADVDLIAPGVCILSTWKGGGYNTISGTSMASPHVAGAAALYKAANPGANPAAVKAALLTAAKDQLADAWTGDRDDIQEPLLNVAGF